MMSLGPIVEGYVLIISKHHFSCCAELPSDDLNELFLIWKSIKDAQIAVYGASTFFEHGRSGSCIPTPGHGEDHCFHAHMHVAPVNTETFSRVQSEYMLNRMEDWNQWSSSYLQKNEPYIVIGADKYGIFEAPLEICFSPKALPKQYLRKVLASAIGEYDLFDWVSIPNHEIIMKGKERLSGLIIDGLLKRGLIEARDD
jgi:diadenosine tetraphosphate (Ap4A) HIT family hydrolase